MNLCDTFPLRCFFLLFWFVFWSDLICPGHLLSLCVRHLFVVFNEALFAWSTSVVSFWSTWSSTSAHLLFVPFPLFLLAIYCYEQMKCRTACVWLWFDGTRRSWSNCRKSIVMHLMSTLNQEMCKWSTRWARMLLQGKCGEKGGLKCAETLGWRCAFRQSCKISTCNLSVAKLHLRAPTKHAVKKTWMTPIGIYKREVKVCPMWALKMLG